MGQAATRQEAFWDSCSYGREWKVRQMLTSGRIDVNYMSHTHQSCPIHVASQGKPEIVRLLLEAGCQVDALDGKGNTALHQASMTGQEEIVCLLLEAGANPSAANERGWTALIMACYFCQPSVVRCLLASPKCDYLLRNSDGRNCLHELCRAAPKSQICQNGKRVSTASLDQSPLYAAMIAQLRSVEEELPAGLMAADWPVANGKPAAAAAADRRARRQAHQPASAPLDQSRFARALVDIAEQLLAPGACPGLGIDDRSQPPESGARGEADFTPLMFAVYHGHLPLARCLLDHGADVGAADMSGWTALHWAVNRELKSIVELLISYGANPERESLRGETPMDLASDDPELRLLLAPIYPEIISNGHVTTDDEDEEVDEERLTINETTENSRLGSVEPASDGQVQHGNDDRVQRMLANGEDLHD
ncbi:hypothetical protein BOX15_Mlig029212g4 [Macrostomum lignano]|uniref:Uncharacterized protein n=1 Tax=Macrostomum lignano TaxID=282301 RepID=A0A267GC30_9PLAT|nr:hypothetical protein BOX15_Mlig029212g4 [Macrostomum lignano]